MGAALSKADVELLAAWSALPERMSAAIARLDAAALDAPTCDHEQSPRQTLHHLAEAQVVAASIMIAALGSPGCRYDWAWMQPFGPWSERMPYGSMPVEPSLALLRGVASFIAAILRLRPDGFDRTLQVAGWSDGTRTMSVRQLLQMELDHALEHLGPLLAPKA